MKIFDSVEDVWVPCTEREKNLPLKELETFSSRTEKVLHNLKETSARYDFLCLFLIKTLTSQDGEHCVGYLKMMLYTTVLCMKSAGSESCIHDMCLFFHFHLHSEIQNCINCLPHESRTVASLEVLFHNSLLFPKELGYFPWECLPY